MCLLKLPVLRSGHRFLPFLASLLFLAWMIGLRSLGQMSGVAAEGASTIGKSRFMIGGYYSTAFPEQMIRYDNFFRQPGVKVGVGISNFIDIKFYYSRWAVRGSNYPQNVFQLISKVTGAHQMVAVYIPFGFVYSRYRMNYERGDIGMLWMVTPRLIATLIRKKHFDLCLVPYIEVLHEKRDRPCVTGGINLGAGWCTLPERLTLRIEGGIDFRTLSEGYPFGTIGIGLSYAFRWSD